MGVFDDALMFAAERHHGMVRKKNAGVPYLLHPMETAVIVGTMTNDHEVLAAALLHDVVEDTNTTIEEVRERFGDRVAELVSSETENKREDLPPGDTWRIRKEESGRSGLIQIAFRDTIHPGSLLILWNCIILKCQIQTNFV